MTLFKHEIPILEHDDNPIAVIMPNHEALDIQLPKKCVYAFLGSFLDEYAKKHQAKVVGEFISATKIYPIYILNYQEHEVCLVQAPVGSAAAAQLFDWLISYGVKEIISTGTCGSLIKLPENTFLVPKLALRDEGASYHYLAPSRYVKINKKTRKVIEDTLTKRGLKYQEVLTWSTDGFFRETRDLVNYRIEEGCSVVEMECASLAAVAEFRKVLWGQILFTADSLADIEQYDPRNWGDDSREYALNLCFDAVLNL